MYSIMMRSSHGIDACDNLYIVRMHKRLANGYELVKCTDYRDVAQRLIDNEFERLKR